MYLFFLMQMISKTRLIIKWTREVCFGDFTKHLVFMIVANISDDFHSYRCEVVGFRWFFATWVLWIFFDVLWDL